MSSSSVPMSISSSVPSHPPHAKRHGNGGKCGNGGESHRNKANHSETKENVNVTANKRIKLISDIPSSSPSLPSPSVSVNSSILSSASFSSLSLSPQILKALSQTFQYETMSKIQSLSIPCALKGGDAFFKAKTGSGKTLGFLIPTVHKYLNAKDEGKTAGGPKVFALIISPTRELAIQIETEAKNLCTFISNIRIRCCVGGTNIKKDLRDLQSGSVDFLIATPGRLLDLCGQMDSLRKGLRVLNTLILDEADRLLDMGFQKEIDAILSYLPDPSVRQCLLFSATLSEAMKLVVLRALKPQYDLLEVPKESNEEGETNVTVEQKFAIVPMDCQIPFLFELITSLIKSNPKTKVIVFFTTARMTGFMSDLFNDAGIKTFELHSRLSQTQRNRSSEGFRAAASAILFSSDVAARGMDYPNVTHVIQCGIVEREQYIHRVGRTARAGEKGEGIFLLTKDESSFLDTLKRDKIPLSPLVWPTESLAKMVKDASESEAKIDWKSQNSFTFDPQNNPSLLYCPSSSPLRTSLLRVSSNDNLSRSAEQLYAAWVGFFNTHLRPLGWNKGLLISHANRMAQLIGCKDLPGLTPKAIGMLGLKGMEGIRKVNPQDIKGGGRGEGGRGGGGHGRGGGGHGQRRPSGDGDVTMSIPQANLSGGGRGGRGGGHGHGRGGFRGGRERGGGHGHQ